MAKKRKRKKLKKPRLRIPVAPPGSRHKSKKDYKRSRKTRVRVDDTGRVCADQYHID